MRILISLSSTLRLLAVCFVLGVVVGMYLGLGGEPTGTPPDVENSAPVNATAP